ncbi:MAG: riboflavin synthase [Ignavibacteriales bacterium]|nr:riboflavin synthase [Ignavibacteriales bacterium]
MFTGIIEELGKIKSIQNKGEGLIIEIEASKSVPELNVKESVAINGVCQTVVKLTKSSFFVEAVEETLKKTTFNTLKSGDIVNLELPMKPTGRLGGHIVLGHVDTVCDIVKIENKANSILYTIKIKSEDIKFVVTVGSIAIDGISLTLASVKDNLITVSIIPHTQKNTIVKYYKVGTKVNIEYDIIGKYVDKILKSSGAGYNQLTTEILSQNGF